MNHSCISLLTDFGLQDTYVGQMKGVIFGINPSAVVVDVTHAIPPQQILQGALALSNSVAAFPPGTIHVAIVDPGVGTTRRAIAAEVGPYRFVCPDNGLLTLILKREPRVRAVELDVAKWWREPVSLTFHGRDVFAPVAAAWSLGHGLAELGTAISTPLVQLPWPEAQIEFGHECGTFRGEVIAIDHFGNLITNLFHRIQNFDSSSRAMAEGTRLEVEVAGKQIQGIVRCYGERRPGEYIALFGSSGWLEVSIVNGNAAAELKAGLGNPVTVRWSS